MDLEGLRAGLTAPMGRSTRGLVWPAGAWETWAPGPELLCAYLVPVLGTSLFCFRHGLTGNVLRSTGQATGHLGPAGSVCCVYVCVHMQHMCGVLQVAWQQASD